MTLEPVIGLEIHVQLKTKSKMFCSCANIFGDVEPNSAICPICLGYPGTLPVPNATAIEWTRLAGAALNCELIHKSKFDRKSYFYPDLPKGYQISQYDQPFCGRGELAIVVDGQERKIGITRIHLEEDAAKNTHPANANYTLIDFNRAGTPLMEIVTEPDIKTPAEAKTFLQELQRIMRALGVSDADMEKGQMRCDANISLREKGSKEFNPKIEVKNLNSFRNVERALAYEIKRQTKLWEGVSEGVRNPEFKVPDTFKLTFKLPDTLKQQTRGWDADAQKTTEQRTKEEAADYRYFPEPDIPPFVFTEADDKKIKKQLPELPLARRKRFESEYGLAADQAQLFVDLPPLADYFENVVSELNEGVSEGVRNHEFKVPDTLPKSDPLTKSAANLVLRELKSLLPDIKITPENFAEVVVLVEQGKITKTSLSKLLAEMQATGGDPDPLIEKLGLAQVSDTGKLDTVVEEVIAANPDVVAKIKAGKDSALQFLMGQVMAKTKGKASAPTVVALLKKKLA